VHYCTAYSSVVVFGVNSSYGNTLHGMCLSVLQYRTVNQVDGILCTFLYIHNHSEWIHKCQHFSHLAKIHCLHLKITLYLDTQYNSEQLECFLSSLKPWKFVNNIQGINYTAVIWQSNNSKLIVMLRSQHYFNDFQLTSNKISLTPVASFRWDV